MYISQGIVYGAMPHTEIRIKDAKPLDNMMLLLTFEGNERRLFDATILKGEAFQCLEDENVFFDLRVDHGVVTWKDGEIDCAPEYMYQHSYEYPQNDQQIIKVS